MTTSINSTQSNAHRLLSECRSRLLERDPGPEGDGFADRDLLDGIDEELGKMCGGEGSPDDASFDVEQWVNSEGLEALEIAIAGAEQAASDADEAIDNRGLAYVPATAIR